MANAEDKAALASEFSEITQLDIEDSMMYLEASNFNLDNALNLFYENSFADDPSVKNTIQQNELSSQKSEPIKYIPEKRSKIVTMDDLATHTSDDDEEKKEKFFVGGSGDHGGSNTQVVGPDSKTLNASEIFKRAKNSGAKIMDPSEFKAQKALFDCGAASVDGKTITKAEVPESITIDIYSNGFLASGEDFFDISDPKTKEYMENIVEGSIPIDLMRRFKCKSLKPSLFLNDLSSEIYTPPKTHKNFAGAFKRLGSPCPSIVTSKSSARKKIPLTVDPQLPAIKLQYRLNDGTRRTVLVNSSVHTTSELYDHISSETPVGSSFILMAGYPPVPIMEDDTTIDKTELS
ncbi:hypothetical protein HZS_1709, partial [Henneguya salminicola]